MYKIILSKSINPLANAVVTIGNFDGLHLGHFQLIKRVNTIANNSNLRRVLITFEPSSVDFFFDQQLKDRLPRLSLLRDKFLILKRSSLIDELIILRFNSKLAKLTPNQFIKQILIDQLHSEHVVIGNDFKFGALGVGSFKDFIINGIQVTMIEKYLANGQRISSSRLRELAKNNDLNQLATNMGRNIQYSSRVIYGNQIGRKYGVPTINLALGHNRPALWGIYVGYVYIDDVRYNAVINVGQNPTVTDTQFFKLEAHLLDVDLDLYGKIATIEILQYLREEKKFNNLNALFVQIAKDLQNTRDYFAALLKT